MLVDTSMGNCIHGSALHKLLFRQTLCPRPSRGDRALTAGINSKAAELFALALPSVQRR
jgi:hypothetical protein